MKLAKRVDLVNPSLTLAISAKAKAMKAEGIGVISFAAGEPDFDTPDYIKEEAKRAIAEGFTKYTAASGIQPLKEAICRRFKEDNNLDYEPSQVIVSCGAKHSLYNILQVLCDPGDEVLLTSPYWLTYPEQVKLAGGVPVIVETEEKEGFRINPEKLKEKVTSRTKLLILNSPNNPTGAVQGKEELEQIGEVILQNKIRVISDEIYEKIIYDGEKHVSIASLAPELKDLSVVVNGVSKAYSMTGWRIGYAAGKKEIIQAMGKIQSQVTSNPNSIAQRASLAALTQGGETVEKMVSQFQQRRDYLIRRLKDISQFSFSRPRGAFYLFLNVSRLKSDSVSLANKMLEEVKVALVPGKAFGDDRYLRLSFAASLEDIKEGLDRIEGFLNSL